MPDTFCQLKRVMNAQKTHVTDVDTWYYENRNIQLLLHLLVSSTGLGSSLRCLTAIDANFHESCTPNILVTILTTLSDLKFMIQGNVETTSGGSVVVQISIKDKPILQKMMSKKACLQAKVNHSCQNCHKEYYIATWVGVHFDMK